MRIKKMTNTKWPVNVSAFILFCVLAATGLINWLLLPKGHAANSGILYGIKQLVCGTHELVSVLFIIVIAIHVAQHWKYIHSRISR